MEYHPQATARGREAASSNSDMPTCTRAAGATTATAAPTAPRAEAASRRRAAKRGRGRGAFAPGASLYDEVTARIVAQLEAGCVPWVQPWDAAAFAPGLPQNADSGRSYSGINILILWGEAAARGFTSQRWLTFRQAQRAGGAVRKGEKGTTIFYAARFAPKGEKEGNGEGDGDGGAGTAPSRGGGMSGGGGGERSESKRTVAFLKRLTVFNVDQCEDLPERCRAGARPETRQTVPIAEALIAATGADIRIGGNEAYYSPRHDFIAVPPQQAFCAQIDYYRTALHELGHWTGHASRLGRDQSGAFSSAAYGREELCAELASACLCASLGIKPTVRHADYIGAWLGIMRADSRAIFKAASHASKAADYLLAFAPERAAIGEPRDDDSASDCGDDDAALSRGAASCS